MDNKTDFIFTPFWWQTFIHAVLGLRNCSNADVEILRYYELQGFLNGLFMGGVINSHERRRMTELVDNARDHGRGVAAYLSNKTA